MNSMRTNLLARLIGWTLLSGVVLAQQTGARGTPTQTPGETRLRVLVVSGGCCHEYTSQDKILMDTIRKSFAVDWTVVYQGGTSSDAKIPLYDSPNWARGFDLVIHNECYGAVGDENLMRTMTAPHRDGIPAMVLHCSMHSYRAATVDDWREFLGVTSRRHTRAHAIAVKVATHEIMAGFKEDWVTPIDELYVVEKLWPKATALATAISPEEGKAEYAVVWTNDYNGTRVFGTTLGHGDTWNDPVYQELLTRGFRWALNKK